MNILTISTRIYPDKTGIAKQVYLISEYISQKCKIIIVTCNPYNNQFQKKIVNKFFKIYYLPIKAPGINAGFLKMVSFFFKFFILAMKKSINIIKNERINIIHAHSPAPSGYIALAIKKIYKLPYFYTIHGIEEIIKIIHLLDFKLTMKFSEKTLVVSKMIKNHLREKFGVKNLKWFPNGIDIDNYFHIKKEKEKEYLIRELGLDSFLKGEDLIICYVGYMIFWQKTRGMIDFLHAFKKFLHKIQKIEERSRIKLLYIGDGIYSDHLIKMIERLELRDNVCFLGYREDVKLIFAISNLLVLTSYLEGSPLVILEAMASKVPCLGSSVGDIPYMINDTGFLVKAGDVEKMIRKLEEFYDLSKIEREALNLSAYTRIQENYSIQAIGKDLYNLYQKTLKKYVSFD
jgi:glycosyltransferase involved in cell wall biosynthesis